MALRLGIDAWNLPHDRRGIGRYTRAILQQWSSWGSQHVTLALIVPERWTWLAAARYRAAAALPSVPVCHRSAIARLHLDAVWFPWNGMSWNAPGVCVATLHDASVFCLAPSNAKAALAEQRPFRTAAAHARRIITDSEFAKHELIAQLDLNPECVDVIYLGVESRFFEIARSNLAQTGRRQLLFVGEPEERKGLDLLYVAVALLPTQLRSVVEIVIVGSSGRYPLPASPASAPVRNLGYVSEEQLAAIYADAAMLVHPSAYEGFGLPLLEAMAAGTPVVASDAGSAREAAGDAALLVPPHDAQALAAAIERVLTDETLARDLRRRGRIRAEHFTWDATARATLASIQTAIDAA